MMNLNLTLVMIEPILPYKIKQFIIGLVNRRKLTLNKEEFYIYWMKNKKQNKRDPQKNN